MTSCPKMVDAGRRKFLSGAGLAAAGMAAATVVPSRAESAPAPARVEYPSNRLANVRDLKVDEPVNVSYPDRDAPGVLLKLGKRVPTGVGPDGDIVGLLDHLPAQGISAELQQIRPHPELPRPLLALRLRCGRPADLGPGDAEPPAVHAARRCQRRHLRRGPRRAALRPAVQRALRGGNHGLQASNRPPPDHPGGCEGVQRHLPLLHRRLRLQGLHLGREQAGRHGRRTRTSSASTSASSRRPRPRPGTRPRCTTSSSRTAKTFTSSSSPTRTAW